MLTCYSKKGLNFGLSAEIVMLAQKMCNSKNERMALVVYWGAVNTVKVLGQFQGN